MRGGLLVDGTDRSAVSLVASGSVVLVGRIRAVFCGEQNLSSANANFGPTGCMQTEAIVLPHTGKLGRIGSMSTDVQLLLWQGTLHGGSRQDV